jgi:ubiquinone/menaquinone biosynthesis C-methylase UbiE
VTIQAERPGFAHVDRTAYPGDIVRLLDAITPMWLGMRRLIDTALDAQPGDRVLDVGCGTGEAARGLAPRVGPAGRLVAVDSSATMVGVAAARGGADGPVAYLVADAHDLPFPDESFDGCRAERIFSHLEDPARVAAELCRVTRPGGRIVMSAADQETLVVDVPDRELTRRILNHCCDTWLVNGWASRQLSRLARQADLTDITVAPYTAVLTDLRTGVGSFDFREHAEHARAAGVVTAAEAAGWMEQMEAMDRAGRFFSALTGFVVGGLKPD